MTELDEFLKGASLLARLDTERGGFLGQRTVDGVEVIERIAGYAGGQRYHHNPLYEIIAPYLELDFLYGEMATNHSIVLTYARFPLCQMYAWAIPSPQTLRWIKDQVDQDIIELGSGRGYWAKQLRRLGVKVTCVDIHPGHIPGNVWAKVESSLPYKGLWHPVQRADIDVLDHHRGKALLLCWPPYQGDFARRALERYMDAGGDTVIYVGELASGCCADDDFFDLLDNEWKLDGDLGPMARWWGIHDTIGVWRR